MKETKQNNQWYGDNSTLEQKKNWYASVADAYHRTRPRYQPELIQRAIELAQLNSKAKILEIGSGPGTATVPFAKLGFSLTCLEPSQPACQLAQDNCKAYPQVKIYNTTFEEWSLGKQKFDAVLAATSFHWVSPQIGYPKTVQALHDNGCLILLWNTVPQTSYQLYQALRPVYQIHAPHLGQYEDPQTQQNNLNPFITKVMNSGFFHNLISEHRVCEVTYTINDYLDLLSTLSPYIALEAEQRDALFTDLRTVLEQECGETMETVYLCVMQITQKFSTKLIAEVRKKE